ncbi:MAG: DUF2135 domain-containing protein [Tannerella sp.]|nr:DUF2135 domain-containing protein [Tannerella sp.]
MKRLNLLYLSLLMTFIPSSPFAQMPSMKIQGEPASQPSAVLLEKMDIDVEIFGNVAVTTMKMVFHNHSDRVLEGELTFPMPEGVTVSRYAIDINGKLRDGVPVAKAKATEVFESIEHRNVDPGLLERVEGNNFRTRVYPLPANGERTVLVACEEALTFKNGRALQYHLPLGYRQRIASFSLRAKVYQTFRKPQLVEQPDDQFTFSGDSRVYEASMQKTNYQPAKALTVNLPKETNIPEAVLQKNTDGSSYFLINAYPSGDARPKSWSDRIGIIWDNSLSGLHRDKEKELALLDKIILQKQNLTIELGLLNISFKKAKSFTVKNGDWSELKTYLQALVYDGGTDFSRIDTRAFSAGEYLLFSEGLSTFGEKNVSINKPVHCINSSVKADYSALKVVSAKTGGKFVNLANTSVDEAFRLLSQNNLQFMGIEEQRLVSEVYPSIPVETNGHLSVTGIIRTTPGEITLLFGHNGKVETRQKVKLQAQATDIRVNRIWAQKKIAEMDVQYEQHKDDIERLGKQFGIVTRNTSLLVLENVADYVRYEITPPDELLAEYNRLTKEQRARKEARVHDLLARAIEKVDELKGWWNTDFKPEKQYPKPEEEAGRIAMEDMIVAEDRVVAEDMEIAFSEDRILSEAPQAQYEEAVVIGYANARRAKAKAVSPAAPAAASRPAQPVAEIRISKIRNDKAYVQQIASAADPYAAYLSLRETYMGTPGFFLDVSEFFYDRKQDETGLLIVSSLADLELENAELFKTLAYKLKEKGNYVQELFITRKIREWRPMDLQSHRDYALALQDNGRYQDALESLYGILNASYSPEAALRDNGIEEILVCEINNLISRHRNKLNLNAIDSGLVAGLPVNVRVVINWNKNDTDIDLWVTDPNGERCMYSHKQTVIGGRLSNDFTRGYGPEQFLLKKAVNGTYKVETNFFGERQLTLSGPTTIMAEIYLYYSDGRQERKVITFRNGENGKEKNGVLIGEFVFSGSKETAGITPLPDKRDEVNGSDEIHEADTSEATSFTFVPTQNPYPWVIGLSCLAGLWVAGRKKETVRK